MASKYGIFGCLTCGEYLKDFMNNFEVIEQFDMHMCCADETLNEKKQKLMNLRRIIDTTTWNTNQFLLIISGLLNEKYCN